MFTEYWCLWMMVMSGRPYIDYPNIDHITTRFIGRGYGTIQIHRHETD